MFNQVFFKSTCLAMLCMASLFFTACRKDDETAEENITKIELHFTSLAGGIDKKFYWVDTDGDDVANQIDTIVLPANSSSIKCEIRVYDESQSPALDLTPEIQAESNSHLFVYTLVKPTVIINYDDFDEIGKIIGLKTIWNTGDAGSDVLNIKLYHEPANKENLVNPGGEIDFNIDFPVKVL